MLECIFTDVMSQIMHQSIGKLRYFVTLLVSHSGYSLFLPVYRRTEAADAVAEIIGV